MMRAKLSTCVLLLATACHLHAAGMPASGASMRAVEQEFGAPLKKNAPVGQPPITRWEYNGFVVVFERSTVVQSVEIAGKNTAAPVPAPSPAPVIAPAAAPPPAAPVAAKPVTVQSNIAEIERQTKEREVMAKATAEKAKAEAEAAAKAAAVPAPEATAPVAPAPVVAAPVAPAPVVTAPVAPVKVTPAAPEPAPAPETKKPKGDGSYTFDPATGRIIIN